MNFQNLESFLVLAEEGSVTRAAERLHVSQQALSGLLARLEKEAGSPLFFRRSGLELTYAGICLQRAAIQILDIQRQTIAAMQDIDHGKVGPVPRHLQNVHADSSGMEREQGYLYPHDFPGHWVQQQYLPDELKGKHYYEYGDNKTEQAARAYWQRIKGE
mgnify:CR=1 FL=1